MFGILREFLPLETGNEKYHAQCQMKSKYRKPSVYNNLNLIGYTGVSQIVNNADGLSALPRLG